MVSELPATAHSAVLRHRAELIAAARLGPRLLESPGRARAVDSGLGDIQGVGAVAISGGCAIRRVPGQRSLPFRRGIRGSIGQPRRILIERVCPAPPARTCVSTDPRGGEHTAQDRLVGRPPTFPADGRLPGRSVHVKRLVRRGGGHAHGGEVPPQTRGRRGRVLDDDEGQERPCVGGGGGLAARG